MELLTAELRSNIPPLYTQEHLKLEDRTIHAKFFFPAGSWTWFVTEGQNEEDDFLMFGYVVGFEREWGYFSLNELQAIEINGLKVERDLYFEPALFSLVISREFGT